jgi:tripartite-type tricarboxylate transporter receptor subunit TctC
MPHRVAGPTRIECHLTRRAVLGAAAAVLAAPRIAQGEAPWPERPVHLVVPYAPGGPSDILARALSEKLYGTWRQPIVVDNKPGAGSSIGTAVVARAAPDGLTLLLGASAHVMNPPLMPQLPYDAVRDFTPIIQAAFHPMVLVVHPSVPVHSVAELLARAKASPGAVTIGSAGIGNASHLAAALLQTMAGVEFTHVPYNGSAPAQTAIMGGQVEAAFLNSTTATPQLRAGTLRGLGVASLQRWRELPDLPTIAEQGFPGYEVVSWYGVLAPAGLPAPLLEKLHQDIRAALQTPELREKITAAGLDPMDEGPAQFRATLTAELAKWSELIRTAGIKAD